MAKKLLISDIDGTLLAPDSPYPAEGMIKAFNNGLKRSGLVLAYSTGRHLALALAGLKKSGLKEPDYLICDVGTSIYVKRQGKWQRDQAYDRIISQDWPDNGSKEIVAELKDIIGLKKQEKARQGRYKTSYYLPLNRKTEEILERADKTLKRAGIKVNAIYSVDREKGVGLLDLLPPKAGKLAAFEYLENKAGLDWEQAVFAGDSGNDREIMLSGRNSVLVNNARPGFRQEMKKAQKKKNLPIYWSALNYASGVREGLKHYGFAGQAGGKPGIYIQMHSIHGLFRSQNLELGRDEDTGGQIVYVLELARALARDKRVERVDILTRRIADPDYPGYSDYIEEVDEKVRIVRIECGGSKYIMKVDLWPHLDEYIENTVDYISRLGRAPDIIHSNYADAGWAGAKLSQKLGAPQVHTGHSLGRNKMKRLGLNSKNRTALEKRYHFHERLRAEAEANANARAIIVSSAYERREQYRPYEVSAQSRKFHIVEPGIDYTRFWPYYSKSFGKKAARLKNRLDRRLRDVGIDSDEPMVLCISRLDQRKNIISLLEAYGRDSRLKAGAVLVLALGPLNNLSRERKELLRAIKKEVRASGSGGRVKFIERLDQDEVGELYRAAARSRGVFVNPALIEPFGLTLLEAGACGLPLAATRVGGPVDIVRNCRNGELFDPIQPASIARAIKRIIFEPERWKRYSDNGAKLTRQHYSWAEAAKKEIRIMEKLISKNK